MVGKLTPRERVILAKEANKLAKHPKIGEPQKQRLRVAAANLLAINMAAAKRKKPD